MANSPHPDGKRRMPEAIRQRARHLRTSSTEAETKLWYFLRAGRFGGLKFRRQHPVGPYVLDFYCHALGLGIELDGGGHATTSQAARDSERTNVLADHGIRILRFWNHEVLKETEAVLEVIWRTAFGGDGEQAIARL